MGVVLEKRIRGELSMLSIICRRNFDNADGGFGRGQKDREEKQTFRHSSFFDAMQMQEFQVLGQLSKFKWVVIDQ